MFVHLTHLSPDEEYNLIVTEYADKNATESTASVKITVDADATIVKDESGVFVHPARPVWD